MEILAFEMAEEALKKENEKRRKIRQSQVRVQTHEWMEKNRRRYQEEKERQIKLITQVLATDVQAKAVENIELMERMHDLCAAEVGAAHRAAANLPNFDEVKALKNRENTLRALNRGHQALLQEKQEAERARQAARKAQILRENLRKAEDYKLRENAARVLQMTKSQGTVDRNANKLGSKQSDNRRRPDFQPSLAKSLRVPKDTHSETRIGNGGKESQQHGRSSKRKPKIVTYYDSAVPLGGVLRYPPPPGLVQRHGKSSPKMNAFENARKLAEEQRRRERKNDSIQAQRAKEVQKRGKSALKVERLQRQLTEITNQLTLPPHSPVPDKLTDSVITNELPSPSPSEKTDSILSQRANEVPVSSGKSVLTVEELQRQLAEMTKKLTSSLFLPIAEEEESKEVEPKGEMTPSRLPPPAKRSSKSGGSSSRSSSIRTLSIVDSTELDLDGTDHHQNVKDDKVRPADKSRKGFPVTSTPGTDSSVDISKTSSSFNTTPSNSTTTPSSNITTNSSGRYSPRTAAMRRKALDHYIKRLLHMCPESMENLAIGSSLSSTSFIEIPSSDYIISSQSIDPDVSDSRPSH